MPPYDVQTGTSASAAPPVGYAQGVSNPPNGGHVQDIDHPEPSDAAMVPVFAPDGSLGRVPQSRLHDAMNAGAKRAEFMVAPDGKTGYIPADRVQDAVKAGAKFGSPDQPSNASLYARALFNPVGSGAASGISGGLEQIGGRAMQGIIMPLAHPLNTAAGIGQMIAHPIDTAEQRINEFKQEWGQNPALALENAAGDAVGAVEGGRLGSGAMNIGTPLALKGIGRAALLGKTPEEAYLSAIKPSTTLSAAERGNVAQAGIENAIPVSKGGLEKLQGLIAKANQARQDVINQDPTRPISPGTAIQNLRSVRAKFANQVNPASDMSAVDSAGHEFLDQLRTHPGGAVRNLTAQEAQDMKTGTYRALGNKAYGELKSANIEAQKSLARGLKDELANQFPELKNLNAQESKMLDLEPVLERAVNRIGNHQVVGIGTPIAGAAGAAVTGSAPAGLVIGAMKAAIDNPWVKSRLAIAVSKGGKIPLAQATAKVAAYSSALGSYTGSSGSSAPASALQP